MSAPESTSLLVYSGEDALELDAEDVVWVPVTRFDKVEKVLDSGHCEVVLPISGSCEAVPGLWSTGEKDGMVCLTGGVRLEPGTPVAEVRVGAVATGLCDSCGYLDTAFLEKTADSEACATCGRVVVAPPACGRCGAETFSQ